MERMSRKRLTIFPLLKTEVPQPRLVLRFRKSNIVENVKGALVFRIGAPITADFPLPLLVPDAVCVTKGVYMCHKSNAFVSAPTL